MAGIVVCDVSDENHLPYHAAEWRFRVRTQEGAEVGTVKTVDTCAMHVEYGFAEAFKAASGVTPGDLKDLVLELLDNVGGETR